MAGTAYIHDRGTRIALGNDLIERTLSVSDGVLRTTAVLSKPADRELTVDSEEIRLLLADGTVLTNSSMRVATWSSEETEGGGRRVTVDLVAEAEGVEAVVEYELAPGDLSVRKTIRLAARGGPTRVESLDVERFRCRAETRLGGRGQPLFIDDTFFLGLEYPAGFNENGGDCIALRHYPSWLPAEGDLVSKTAVIGAAPAGEVEAWFAQYIDRIRRRGPYFVSLNSGGDVQIYEPMATPDLEERVEERTAELARTQDGTIYSMAVLA